LQRKKGHSAGSGCALYAFAKECHNDNITNLPLIISDGIWLLINLAEKMAFAIPLDEAIEARWAARGLMVTLKPYANHCFVDYLQSELSSKLPRLDERVSKLPFDILPRAVSFLQCESVHALQQDILFHVNTLETR
jgi:hypothetical protein